MTGMATARTRLEQAEGIAAVLDAAHDAFDAMLQVIRAHEDPADGLFIPLVMAAASAAAGRNALVVAPSLPPHSLPATPLEDHAHDPRGSTPITVALAALSDLLAARLTTAAASARDPADATACTDAAQSARAIHALLTGTSP
jgi:hypothetical protein